ncbi:MAG: MvdC/MvdD family ATP grasp protein [Pseudomonadota bacterium]
MILIISSDDDMHALAVMDELRALGRDATLLNLADFPKNASLVVEPGSVNGRRELHLRGQVVDLSRINVVWWRRPQPYGMHEALVDPVDDNFALHEVDEAIQGLYLTLDATWINDPARDQQAARKLWQLDVARDVGLEVPRTMITNDPDAARDFIAQEGARGVIYKPFQGSEEAWRETRLLKPEETKQLDAVKYAPVIFQEYIEAEVDIRVTVVGDQLFAAAIHSQKAEYKVDFRMDMSVEITPIELSAEVSGKLRALMHRLGLKYGAIDLRRRPDGRDVFLEINPAGQWLFVEDKSQQPISRAMAGLMARHERPDLQVLRA